MNNLNWILISGISSFLNHAEENFSWNLSIHERASYLEVFYNELNKKFPESLTEIKNIFNLANVHTYGEDHTCDEPTKEEIQGILEHCSDFYKEKLSLSLVAVYHKIQKICI